MNSAHDAPPADRRRRPAAGERGRTWNTARPSAGRHALLDRQGMHRAKLPDDARWKNEVRRASGALPMPTPSPGQAWRTLRRGGRAAVDGAGFTSFRHTSPPRSRAAPATRLSNVRLQLLLRRLQSSRSHAHQCQRRLQHRPQPGTAQQQADRHAADLVDQRRARRAHHHGTHRSSTMTTCAAPSGPMPRARAERGDRSALLRPARRRRAGRGPSSVGTPQAEPVRGAGSWRGRLMATIAGAGLGWRQQGASLTDDVPQKPSAAEALAALSALRLEPPERRRARARRATPTAADRGFLGRLVRAIHQGCCRS